MYDHVLIPVDGSEEATRAARHGLELAAAFDATVDVLHVVERKALQLTRTADEETQLEDRGTEILDEVGEIASELGQSITTHRTEGSPSSRIVEHAADRGAGLIVIGRQGTSGIRKRLLGGVTEQVLHRSEVPVLVVSNGDRPVEGATDYDRVLIPTDGSGNAALATPHGVAIAERYGSTIHVVNVVDLQAAGGAFSAGGLESDFVERLEESGEAAVESIVERVEETADGADVETAVVRTTEHEGAAAGIREYAATNDVDLIVLGSHGRSNLKRQLLGGVTSTLLRTVDCPVLVVKRTP